MFLYKTLLFMTLGYVKKMYKNIMGEMGLQTIALCTLSSSISALRQKISKNMTRMLRFIVPDDPLQNSSFHDTWLYLKKCIKVFLAAELPSFSLFFTVFPVGASMIQTGCRSLESQNLIFSLRDISDQKTYKT